MWRLVMGLGSLLLALPLTVACGGVTEGGSDDPRDGTPSSMPVTSESEGPSDNAEADTDLGECKLGALENRATDQLCAWVADKRCYQTREMACNCACPRSRNSQCSSGFDDGPDGHVWVACD
jgi:hypothetical protein